MHNLVNALERRIYCSYFPREGGHHATQATWGAPGLVRRQKQEGKAGEEILGPAFSGVSMGKSRQAE